MEFTRRKWKDKDKKTHRRWMDKSKSYQITWTNQYGYKHFHALVRCLWKGEDKWHFAEKIGPYKTFKKAVEACEKNHKLWDAFIQLSHAPGRRDAKFLELKARAPQVFWFIPKWVWPEADGHFIRMMYPCAGSLNDRDSSIEESETGSPSDSDGKPPKKSSKTRASGLASNVVDGVKSDTKKTGTSSKDTSSPPGTPAPIATEPAAGSKRRSKSSTKKSSKSSEPSSPAGKSKTASAKAPSKNSRRKK